MNGIINMAKVIKNLLIEAELKEVVGKLKQGDVMHVILDNGESHTFEILSTISGNFIVKSKESNNQYSFGVDDYKDGKLTVTQKTETGENMASFKVNSLRMGSKGGHIYTIDPSDGSESEEGSEDVEGDESDDELKPDIEGMVEDVEGFNKSIQSAEVDDVLEIDLSVEENGDLVPYELTFKVVEVHESKLKAEFVDSKGEGESSQYFIDNLNGRQMIFDRYNSFEVRDENVRLSVTGLGSDDTYKVLRLTNIMGLNVSKAGDETDIDGNYTGKGDDAISDAELLNVMKDEPEIVKYFFAQEPNFFKHVNGASPKGRWQIGQMIKNAKLSGSYLSKGSKVEIEIIDRTVNSINDATRRSQEPKNKRKSRYNKTLKRKSTYHGRVIDNNKLAIDGQRDKRHWVVTLKDEVKQNVYKVNYEACLKDDCVNRGSGIIKIIDIRNK